MKLIVIKLYKRKGGCDVELRNIDAATEEFLLDDLIGEHSKAAKLGIDTSEYEGTDWDYAKPVDIIATAAPAQKVQVTAYDNQTGAAWKLMFGDETVEDGFDSTADAEMWARDNGYTPVSQEPENYTVSVCRTGYGFAYIDVMARSPEEAEELAMDEAGDHSYSEKASEYKADGANKF
jgi:hypothetical protein